MKKTEFRFDVALSFAGQDRPYVEAVARAMQSLGLQVFYDQDHHAHLWGKNRTEYEKIYGPDSAYVVPMISKHYTEREWTQWEFETAKREAKKREDDFILPIRIDDTRQIGLTDDHNYLGADDFTPKEIAQALKTKLDTRFIRKRKIDRSQKVGMTVLTAAAREALGIIIAAPIPMTASHLKGLFPDIDWPKHIRRLKQLKLINADGLVDSPKHVVASFTDELAKLESRWVIRLEELQDHVDCALFLSLLYIKQERIDDAVLLVADATLATESDRWMPFCISILNALNNNLLRKMQPETRMKFFHAFGHCLSASCQFGEARAQFEKLRRIAVRRKDPESVGLALLNIGTNYHKQGDIESAIRFYERTRDHAKRHELTMLASHVAGNMGQIEVEIEPERGIELLRESIKLKKKCNDEIGIAGSTQVLAQAFAELGDFDSAIRYYDEAEAITQNLQLAHLETLLLNNKGNTLFEAGKRSEALRVFKKAKRLAYKEGFDELLVRATEGISRVLYSMGKLDEAKLRMEELLELATKTELFEFVMTAHHGLWAANTRLGDYEDGSRHFQALTRLARKRKAEHWLIRGLVDKSRPIQDGNFIEADLKTLKEMITKEARRKNKTATAALWFKLAQICVPNDISAATDALHKCIVCCEDEKELVETLLEAYELLYTLYWDLSGQFEDAIEILDSIVRVAKRHSSVEIELAAINQKGVCLQALSRGREALQHHKRVSELARKQKLPWLVVKSLQNLAECHLRLGDTNAALRVFKKARIVAAESGDEASVIQIDHGRALTLVNTQEFDEATVLFKECRARSLRMELWSEYVRACEAIANLSWTRGRKKTAVKLYEKALSECDARDVVEWKAQIAFNLSQLLRLLGDFRKAHKVLSHNIDLVDDVFLLSEFHSTLAELCEETNQLDDAREHWQIAVQSSENVGDEDEIVYCRSGYAKFERRHGDQKRTIRELDELLKGKLSTEDRGIILKQLFKTLLERKSEKRAESIFLTAQDHLQKYELKEQLIDLYMAAFDHNWIGNRESRFNALQAYVAAFLTAAADTKVEEQLGDIMGRTLLKLTQLETAPSLTQLEWLTSRLENWLTEQLGEAELISTLMHPVRYAEKLIPFNKNPVRFLEEHARLFAEFTGE
ncbi:tetratricopeptide repeat protein [Polystyrenella longa]|nr:tetratricopeptide repeat protein [Polystyrenella longa]